MIASPKIESKFSPSIVISKSPCLDIKRINNIFNLNKNQNNNNNVNKQQKNAFTQVLMKYSSSYSKIEEESTNIENCEEETKIEEIPFIPISYNKIANLNKINKKLKENDQLNKKNLAKFSIDSNLSFNQDTFENSIDSENNQLSIPNEKEIFHRGYLYRFRNNNKLEKIFIKLIQKDMFSKILKN
jgi:hypothetical protein